MKYGFIYVKNNNKQNISFHQTNEQKIIKRAYNKDRSTKEMRDKCDTNNL